MDFAKEILHAVGRFSEEEIAMFEQKLVKRTFNKGELLLQEGNYCKSAYYVISGAAYQFSYDDIDENIIGLYIEADWCFSYYSFVNQKPSNANIKAYTNMEVMELPATSIHELIAVSPSFFQLGKILGQTVTRIQYFDNANTAIEKHNHLFLSRPELFQKFPLRMIASYLKIAPETLSRIRSIK
jgi:CRP-like cAMP-binding protein